LQRTVNSIHLAGCICCALPKVQTLSATTQASMAHQRMLCQSIWPPAVALPPTHARCAPCPAQPSLLLPPRVLR
jgi:hypothetical protein